MAVKLIALPSHCQIMLYIAYAPLPLLCLCRALKCYAITEFYCALPLQNATYLYFPLPKLRLAVIRIAIALHWLTLLSRCHTLRLRCLASPRTPCLCLTYLCYATALHIFAPPMHYSDSRRYAVAYLSVLHPCNAPPCLAPATRYPAWPLLTIRGNAIAKRNHLRPCWARTGCTFPPQLYSQRVVIFLTEYLSRKLALATVSPLTETFISTISEPFLDERRFFIHEAYNRKFKRCTLGNCL